MPIEAILVSAYPHEEFRGLERRAFAILDRYRDHDFSFVDATSLAFMRAERIRHAFAFDSHFAAAGFVRVPADVDIGQLGH